MASSAIPVCAQNTLPPAAPPPAPLTAYLGRFIDSASTQPYQTPQRTIYATAAKVDALHDRIYVIAGGSLLGGYKLSTFVSGQLGTQFAIGQRGEQYLPFEMSVDPEARYSGWQTVAVDAQDLLRDFDFDERGYVYLAYSYWGFGIVDLNGRLVRQVIVTQGEPTPALVLTLASAGNQYLVVSDFPSATNAISSVWDVTDPATPVKVRSLPFLISHYAKSGDGAQIAIVRPDSTALHLYTPEALVSNGTSVAVPPVEGGSFVDVAVDGTTFLAVQTAGNSSTVLAEITATTAGYTTREAGRILNFSPRRMATGAGYVSVMRSAPAGAVLFRKAGSSRVQTDISSYLQANYTGTTATPWVQPKMIVPYPTASGVYALFACQGLGDVYALTPVVDPQPPGAPRNVTARPGNAWVEVSFEPPLSDGGAPVTSYVVTSNDAVTASDSASPVTVAGLTNGNTYTFTVVAVNEAGSSTPSAPSNPATPSATLLAPRQFSAAATSTTTASLTWAAAAGATAYEISRSDHGGAFVAVGPPVAGLSHVDSGLTPNTTYLYSIRSVATGGAPSADASVDPATTMTWTDDPLAAGTTVKAIHFTQLRTGVNAMRAAAALPAVSFAETLAPGMPIALAHLTELRTALDEARAALGLARLTYSGGTVIKAAQVDELRSGVN